MSSSAEAEGESGGGPSEEHRDRDQAGDGKDLGESRASERSSEGCQRAGDGTAEAAGAVHAAATDGEGAGAGTAGREGGGEGEGGGGEAGEAGGKSSGGGTDGKQKFSLSAKTDALRKMVEQRRQDFNKAKAEKMRKEEKRYKAWLQDSKAKRNSIASPTASVSPSSPAVAKSSHSSSPSAGEKLAVKLASPGGTRKGGGGERGEGSGGPRYLPSGSTTPSIASPISAISSKDSNMGSPPPNSPACLSPFPKSVSSPAGSSSNLHAAAGAEIPGPEDKSQRSSSAEESGSGSPVPKAKARIVRRRSVLMVHADSIRDKLGQQMEEMEAEYQKTVEERRRMAAWKEAKGGTWQVDTLLADSDSSYQGYLQAVVEAAALKCELIKHDI